MNMLRNLLLICTSFILFSTLGQDLQLRNNLLPKTKSYRNYIGKDNNYYYYETGKNNISRYKIGKIQQADALTLTYDEPDKKSVFNTDLQLYGDNLFMIAKETRTAAKDEVTSKRIITLYKYTLDGKKIGSVKFERKDTASKYYSHVFDTTSKRIFITRSFKVIASYDFNLEETEDSEIPKKDKKPSLMGDLAFDLSSLFRSMGLSSISINIDGFSSADEKIRTDSSSMKGYKISYSRKKDEDIFSYKHSLEHISVDSKDTLLKDKTVDIELEDDRLPYDISYREDTEGNLVIFGKYIIKGRLKSTYGMFSMILDKKLEPVSKLRYFELSSFPKIEGTIPNMKYIGFVFHRLHDPVYEFHLKEEGTFILTYQHDYNNMQDHIYVLRIDKSGEVIVNRIVNRFHVNKKIRNEKHMAMLAGNKLHFVFYDHVDNLGKEVGDLDYKNGDMRKKTCVLATTTYDILEDQFTKKSKMIDKKAYKQHPALSNPIIHFDEINNQQIVVVRGINSSGEFLSLFEFLFVN